MSITKCTLIGVGNRYRCDDGVGWHIAEVLRSKRLSNTEVILASGEGAALMESMNEKDCVILFDAVHSGEAAGTIFTFDAHQQTIPAKFFNYSTHAFSVAEAIELARAVKQLPRKLIVFGIEGESFAAGIGLSPSVERAANRVVEQAIRLVKRERASRDSKIGLSHA